MTVGSNSRVQSLRVQRSLDLATSAVQRSLTRLSSGLRINSASDDAAGLAVSANLNVNARIFGQAARNVNDAISALNIAQGGLDSLSGIVIRQRELAHQSANGSLSASQRAALDEEATALREQFNQVVASTSFNGINLFSGSARTLSIQQGVGAQNLVGYSFSGAIQRARGAGTYALSQSVSGFSSSGLAVESGDFNQDGVDDIVYSDVNTSQTYVAYGNGNGTFQAGQAIGGGGGSLQVSDLDGDGFLDIVVNDFGSGGLTIFQRKETGFAQISLSISTAPTVSQSDSFDLYDMNSDGILDIVFLASDGTIGTLHLGTDLTVDEEYYSPTVLNYNALASLSVGDFNGDAKADVVVSTDNGVSVLEASGVGEYTEMYVIGSSNSYTSIELVDINNDGLLDLFIGGTAGEGLQGLHIGNGTGGFDLSGTGPALPNTSDIRVVDINGDGKLDVLASTGVNIRQYLGRGDGTFDSATTFGSSTGRFAVGDFNNDGVDDVLGIQGSNSWSLSLQNVNYSADQLYFSLATAEAAESAITYLSTLSTQINSALGALGASQSRLSVGLNSVLQAQLTYRDAASRITDADMALETATLIKNQISQNVGTSILAQVNQTPTMLLRLLDNPNRE